MSRFSLNSNTKRHVKRLIDVDGKQFKFTRYPVNDFREKIKDSDDVAVIDVKGIFHQTHLSMSTTETDATRVFKKPIPAILCLWEDFLKEKVQIDDEVLINESTYKVIAVANVGELNFAADIALELVIDELKI